MPEFYNVQVFTSVRVSSLHEFWYMDVVLLDGTLYVRLYYSVQSTLVSEY